MKQRIAFILPLIDNSNPNPAAMGISNYGASILESLDTGYEVSVLAHTSSGRAASTSQTLGGRGVNVVRCWKPVSLRNPRFIPSLFETVVGLVKSISAGGSDLVHLEYDSSHAYGGTMGEPIIIALAAVKFFLRRPLSVVTHCTWEDEDIRSYVVEATGSKLLSSLYLAYYRLMLKVLFAIADCVVTLTMHAGSRATEINRRYANGAKVFELVHGVPWVEGKGSSSTDRRGGFTALVFSSMRPGKDYETAIVAFGEFLKMANRDDARLVIAGSPGSSFKGDFASSYMHNLKCLCGEQGVEEKVVFDVRHIPEEEVDALFRRADVLLLLYRRRVGPSGVFARAVSCGLPTVMSIDGKFAAKDSPLPAILVEGSDLTAKAKAIAEAMQRLEKDVEFRQKLTTAMVDYGRIYCYPEAAKKYHEMFTRIMEKHRARCWRPKLARSW